MTKEEIFQFMNGNPVFYLATMDGDQPRVRGMLLFRANEDGIIFHTSAQKDVYTQIRNNPKAELCFGNGIQVGLLETEYVQDDELKGNIQSSIQKIPSGMRNAFVMIYFVFLTEKSNCCYMDDGLTLQKRYR